MNNPELAKYVRLFRKNKSWTQAQLAILAGVNERTIQRIEKNGNASAESLLGLASAFDIDVEQLTSLTSRPDQNATKSLLPFSSRSKAWIGFIVILPALCFAISNLLYYNLGVLEIKYFLIPLNDGTPLFKVIDAVSPLIFLGGLSVALLLNLDAMLSVSISFRKNRIKSAIHFKPHLLNLTIVVLSFSTMIIFMVYVFVENIVLR